MQDNMALATVDLQAFCGPRFNTLAPAGRAVDERPSFFRPGEYVTPVDEEDGERWDGLG